VLRSAAEHHPQKSSDQMKSPIDKSLLVSSLLSVKKMIFVVLNYKDTIRFPANSKIVIDSIPFSFDGK
jgi:hypothetical protein